MIRVLFFARLREELGASELALEAPVEAATVASLIDALRARGSEWSEVLGADNILCAVNQQQAGMQDRVNDGDEVAFYPPVTGG